MTVYKVISQSEEDASLVFAEKLASFDAYLFDGRKQTSWQGLQLKWHDDNCENSTETKIRDFALIIGAGVNLTLSEKAKNIIEPILEGDAQYLPITVEGSVEQWYLINITHIVKDALDLESSEFRIMRNGQIGALKKAVFNESNIPDDRAFIYPQATDSFMFKGSLLKDLCQEHKLNGLSFNPIKSTKK